MEPWHSTSGGWCEAGAVPDGVTAAVLWSQQLSCRLLGPGRGQGVLAGGVWAPVHTLPAGGQWVMDEACPGLRAEIIPSLPARVGIYLAPGLTSPSKTPAKEASLLFLAFPRDKGLWAPRPRLRAGGFMTTAMLRHPGDRRGNETFIALIHLSDSEV